MNEENYVGYTLTLRVLADMNNPGFVKPGLSLTLIHMGESRHYDLLDLKTKKFDELMKGGLKDHMLEFLKAYEKQEKEKRFKKLWKLLREDVKRNEEFDYYQMLRDDLPRYNREVLSYLKDYFKALEYTYDSLGLDFEYNINTKVKDEYAIDDTQHKITNGGN